MNIEKITRLQEANKYLRREIENKHTSSSSVIEKQYNEQKEQY